MTLEEFSEEDVVIVKAARKVAVAFGEALFQTIHRDGNGSAKQLWEAFADELSTFVMLTEK